MFNVDWLVKLLAPVTDGAVEMAETAMLLRQEEIANVRGGSWLDWACINMRACI
jgi:hypothetical protein